MSSVQRSRHRYRSSQEEKEMHVKKMSSEEDTSQRAGSQEDPVFKSDYTKTTKLIFTKPVGGKSSSDLDEQGSLLQLQSS